MKTNKFKQIGWLIIFILALLGCVPLSESKTDVPQRELTEIEKAFITADFELIYRIRELPEPIAKLLLERVQSMADPGKPYNATDVIVASLPFTQLTWAGISKDIIFILYKRGGFAPHQQLVLIELKNDQVMETSSFIVPYYIDDIVSLKGFILTVKATPIKW